MPMGAHGVESCNGGRLRLNATRPHDDADDDDDDDDDDDSGLYTSTQQSTAIQ